MGLDSYWVAFRALPSPLPPSLLWHPTPWCCRDPFQDLRVSSSFHPGWLVKKKRYERGGEGRRRPRNPISRKNKRRRKSLEIIPREWSDAYNSEFVLCLYTHVVFFFLFFLLFFFHSWKICPLRDADKRLFPPIVAYVRRFCVNFGGPQKSSTCM